MSFDSSLELLTVNLDGGTHTVKKHVAGDSTSDTITVGAAFLAYSRHFPEAFSENWKSLAP